MSIMVEFPDDIYEALKKDADASAQTPVEWVAKRLPVKPRKPASKVKSRDKKSAKPRTMADVLAGRIGLFNSGGGEWSKDCGAKFAEGMEQKRKAGHL